MFTDVQTLETHGEEVPFATKDSDLEGETYTNTQ